MQITLNAETRLRISSATIITDTGLDNSAYSGKWVKIPAGSQVKLVFGCDTPDAYFCQVHTPEGQDFGVLLRRTNWEKIKANPMPVAQDTAEVVEEPKAAKGTGKAKKAA